MGFSNELLAASFLGPFQVGKLLIVTFTEQTDIMVKIFLNIEKNYGF